MLGLLFGIPAVGIFVGGVLSGWLATRTGPAATLVAATTVGTVGAAGMFAGASWLPAAIAAVLAVGLARELSPRLTAHGGGRRPSPRRSPSRSTPGRHARRT